MQKSGLGNYSELDDMIATVLLQLDTGEEMWRLAQMHNDNGNKDNALLCLMKAAEKGHSKAQFKLGIVYHKGQGVKQNYSKAREWFEKAAKQEHARAQCNLGVMYAEGQGVKQNYSKAREWFEKAAKHGYASAQYCLGNMYHQGHDVKQDYSKAREWYEKAANQELADAQNSLGVMYAKGQGVEVDYSKAIEWYKKAAEQGHVDAQYNLGFIYKNGRGMDVNYKKAIEWYEKAAEQGHTVAQYNLGCMCRDGHGVDVNYKKAIVWFEKAAEQGYAEAHCNLGVMYYHGVQQDYSKAFEFYKNAANQELADAQNNLGIMYAKGQFVKQDFSEAIKWWEKAAKQGHSKAQYNLGKVLYYDQTETAIGWWQKAAEAGHPIAQYKLAMILCHKGDFSNAAILFTQACNGNYPQAYQKLAGLYEKGKGVTQNLVTALNLYEQAALNLPDAHDDVERLKKQNGDEKVSNMCAPRQLQDAAEALMKMGNDTFLPLTTESMKPAVVTPPLCGEHRSGNNRGKWNEEEKKLFLQALSLFKSKHSINWQKVSEYVGTRTAVQCRTHYQKLDFGESKKEKKKNSRGQPGKQKDVKKQDVKKQEVEEKQEVKKPCLQVRSLFSHNKEANANQKILPRITLNKKIRVFWPKEGWYLLTITDMQEFKEEDGWLIEGQLEDRQKTEPFLIKRENFGTLWKEA